MMKINLKILKLVSTSILNIDSNNKEKIELGIKKVIKSFKNKSNKNEIFVQSFLSDIQFSEL